MTTDTPIWQQQPGETAKAYAAFCLYRDMGVSRSLEKTWGEYKEINGNNSVSMPGYFRDWSTANSWVERAKAYDAYLADKRREQFEALRMDQREKRQQIVQALNGMLASVMAEQQKAQQQGKAITPTALTRIANAAAKVLAESRAEFNDMPQQRMAHEVGGKDGGPIEHALTITHVDARKVDV